VCARRPVGVSPGAAGALGELAVGALAPHRTVAIWLALIPCWSSALAQAAPLSPDRPWEPAAELRIEADLQRVATARPSIEASKTYTLAELIDLAESHNPETRAGWERARAQAAALGGR